MAEARMKVSVSDDAQSATLELLPPSGIEGSISLSLEQLGTLILRLGQARASLVAKLPAPPIEGVKLTPVFGTRWAVQPEALTEGSVLAFQHPAFGPVAFVLPPPDLEKMVRALSAHLGKVHTSNEPRQVS